MTYTYNNPYYQPRTITLNRPAPEWVNQDCPNLIREDGQTVLEFGLYKKYIYSNDQQEIEKIKAFVESSDIAFCKKYSRLNMTAGNLIQNIEII